MWLLGVLCPSGRSGCPAQGSALWALWGEGPRLPPDPCSAGLKAALGWVICGIASRPEADWRDGAKFIKMSWGGSGRCAKHVGGRGAGGRLPVPTGTELLATLSLCMGGVDSWHKEEAGITLGAGTVCCHPSSTHYCSGATGTSACRESQNLPCQPTWEGWGLGQVLRARSAHMGTGGGWQPGLCASVPGTGPFPSTSQLGTWWSQSCCRKATCWLPKRQLSLCPLVLPHTLGSNQPFGTVGSKGRMHTKQSFPSTLLVTNPAPLCLVLGHSSGTVTPPHSSES